MTSHLYDRPKMIAGATAVLEGLVYDLDHEHFERTPERFVQMLLDVTQPISFDFTTFKNEEELDEMIVESDIDFYSMCAHHLLPFFGTAVVAYIPTDRIAGLSKLPRLVEQMSKGLNTQERITAHVASELEERLYHPGEEKPLGTACIIRARHLCMEMRGVKKPGVFTTTSAMRGVFIDPTNQARQELLRLAYGS